MLLNSLKYIIINLPRFGLPHLPNVIEEWKGMKTHKLMVMRLGLDELMEHVSIFFLIWKNFVRTPNESSCDLSLIIISDTYAVVSPFKGLSHLSLKPSLEEIRTGIFILISQMRKLRFREIKQSPSSQSKTVSVAIK